VVSPNGELLYDFGPGAKSKLAGSSLRAAVSQAWQKAYPWVNKGVRILFGVSLFASLAILFTSISVLQASSSQSDREDREDRGYGGGGGFFFAPRSYFWGPSPFDWWYMTQPNPYYGGYVQRNREMSFIESVFSFVFGDGDPNYNLEERRYRQIAQVIRNNKGAVVAEQLAPYLDLPDSWFDRKELPTVDEAFVAPVLTRFNGRAEVTPEGNIVYVFDELRPTGTRQEVAVAPVLEEKENKFSRATGTKLFFAGLLGVVNLFGALKLGTLFGSYAAYRTLGPFLDAVRVGYPLLLLYALVYLSVPIWRWFRLQTRNAEIESRNEARAQAVQELTTDRQVVQKIRSTKPYQKKEQKIRRSDAVYSSDRDTTPVEDSFADFDRRLGGEK
jgi:hypothetical protein